MSAKSADTMKADQDRVRKLLSETVIMLCKSGLRYEDQLEIKGVLAITIDKKDVFIVHIDDREVQGNIKNEASDASPCTTSDFDNQYYNGAPAKKMKVEDTSTYQDYATSNVQAKADQSFQMTSPQRASAPQFFTDDIDNQTPLKNISSTSQQNAVEPSKNMNQWALSIPNNPRHPSVVQNNMLSLQQGQGSMMMMARQRLPVHQGMGQPPRQMGARMPVPRSSTSMKMMVPASPGQQRFQIHQPNPMQRMPSGMARPPGATRGSGRGRGRAVSRVDGDAMGAKLVVDSKNIDGFSYGKQTVTQYICNICGVVYKNHSSLLTHQVKTHGRQKKTGVGRRPKHMEDYDEDDAMGMDGSYGYGDDEFDEDYLP